MTTPDIIANLEAAYAAALAEKATRWQARHPADAKQIREAVAAQFRRAGTTDPEPGTLAWMTLEAAVIEAIRAAQGWPTEREFVRLQAGEETPRYVPPKLKSGPVREIADRQKLAAGDR
jgi:hypothetical protein